MRTFAIASVLGILAVSAGCGSSGGKAEVPRTAMLDVGGYGSVEAVSCGAPGDCAAGGYYHSPDAGRHAFVISETNGRWGRAIDVRGTGPHGGVDEWGSVDSVSCVAAGDCSAAGSEGTTPRSRGFVVSETNGRWGKAVEVPGATTFSPNSYALVGGIPPISISCAANGECAADGFASHGQPAVAGETNGRWGKATPVRGIAKLNPSDVGGEVASISCGAPGDCAAGGSTSDRHFGEQAYVVSETNGRWGKAMKVPGMATFADSGQSAVESISCVAVGECTAGGYSTDRRGTPQAVVVTETHGRWGKAIELPGTATLDVGNRDGAAAGVDSLSCVSAGDCAAGGFYTDRRGLVQLFVASETNGRWGKAIEVPGIATLRGGLGGDRAISISCAAAGDCAAGGYYTNHRRIWEAFVIGETNGRWRRGIQVPGTATRNIGGAQVLSVSCGAAGDCAAGGTAHLSGYSQGRAFVVNETNGTWSNTLLSK